MSLAGLAAPVLTPSPSPSAIAADESVWLEWFAAFNWAHVAALFIVTAFVSAPIRKAVRPVFSSVFGLLARIRQVKALGVAFELDPARAAEVREDVEHAFEMYREKVRREFDRQASIHDVRGRLQRLLAEHITPVVGVEYRATVYVPDVLFADSLYQLLGYIPRGGGAGRTLSVRFGIVGAAWRERRNRQEPNVPDHAARVRDWGMTDEEASKVTEKQKAFAAVVLMAPDHAPVGVLFLDSETPGAFGSDEATSPVFEAVAVGSATLVEALDALGREMRSRGPAIRIYRDFRD